MCFMKNDIIRNRTILKELISGKRNFLSNRLILSFPNFSIKWVKLSWSIKLISLLWNWKLLRIFNCLKSLLCNIHTSNMCLIHMNNIMMLMLMLINLRFWFEIILFIWWFNLLINWIRIFRVVPLKQTLNFLKWIIH